MPTRLGAKVLPFSFTSAPAVFMIEALTSSSDHSGCAWRTRAAMPATCGDAIEVPLITSRSLPEPTAVEEIVSPGAATSGLID